MFKLLSCCLAEHSQSVWVCDRIYPLLISVLSNTMLVRNIVFTNRNNQILLYVDACKCSASIYGYFTLYFKRIIVLCDSEHWVVHSNYSAYAKLT